MLDVHLCLQMAALHLKSRTGDNHQSRVVFLSLESVLTSSWSTKGVPSSAAPPCSARPALVVLFSTCQTWTVGIWKTPEFVPCIEATASLDHCRQTPSWLANVAARRWTASACADVCMIVAPFTDCRSSQSSGSFQVTLCLLPFPAPSVLICLRSLRHLWTGLLQDIHTLWD